MKMRRFKSVLVALVALVLVLTSVIGISWALASSPNQLGDYAKHTTTATRARAPQVFKHVVKEAEAASPPPSGEAVPDGGAQSDDDQPDSIRQLKQAAATSTKAPSATIVYPFQGALTGSSSTPPLASSFQGMADANAICPPRGCEAPDMALAASTNWVFQGVNTSFAVYDTAGNVQSGWPKNAQSFFNVPNPPGGCASRPYLIDPRAFYDPNDDRFWATILEDEHAFSHNTSCPFKALYWIAVSQTNDPGGKWNVYAFDMANGTNNGVDFTQLGFDAQAVYFSGNMFAQSGSPFKYAEIFAASKSQMERGSSVTPQGFTNLKLNGTNVDSVQPVMSETAGAGPAAGLFINSLNYNFGGYSCSNSCQGLVVWSIANPTSASPTLTSQFVNSTVYSLSPYASEPACTRCLDTNETQITGTPVYSNGSIYFGLNTGVNNGTQIVPGIFWGQVSPTLDASGALSGAVMAQSGYFNYQGDRAAYYSALMPDANGNLYMVFEVSSSTINPQIEYVARPAGYTPGAFPDSGNTFRAGDANTVEWRWGDFDAAAFDGFSSNNVWLAGEYAPSNGYWSTYIAKSTFSLSGGGGTPTPTATPDPTALPTVTPTPTATPSPTPISTPTPDPTPGGSPLVLYDNGVASGFNDGSFGYSSKNACDTSLSVSPPCSYNITYTAWGALNLRTNMGMLDTSPYKTLEWNLSNNGQPIDDFSVLFTKSGGSVIQEIVLTSSNITADLGNGWVHIAVPLSQLNPSNVGITTVQLKNALSHAINPINIDDITLTG